VVWNFAVSSTITWSRKPTPRPRKLRPGAPLRRSRLRTWLGGHRQLALYIVIGLSAVALDYGVFDALITFAGISKAASTVLSMSCSTVYAFSLNAFLNFKTHDNLHVRFLAYSGVSIIAMTLSAVLLFVFADSMPPIVVLQYLLNKRYSFRGSLEAFGLAAPVSASKERG